MQKSGETEVAVVVVVVVVVGGGVKCDLQSGLLPVYDCSDSEAITAGRTASICLSVYVRQHKRHPGTLFIFSLFSALSSP